MIKIHEEPVEISDVKELCCFCRKPTSFWYTPEGQDPGKAVACCPDCACRAEPQDVPDKKTWIRRERIAVGSFVD
jgi:hypothetical protein